MIEKAFAIRAEPGDIWDALWNDLQSNGDQSMFTILRAHRPRELALNIRLSGIPCELTYRITPRDDDCEVAAVIVPSGLRYGISQVFTFGHFKRNFEMILVQALANLKQSVEPDNGSTAEELAAAP